MPILGYSKDFLDFVRNYLSFSDNLPLPLPPPSLDASIVRTVPIVVALITALMMMCLGPPRQMIGFQNVEETCPKLEKQVGHGEASQGE